MLPTLIDQVAQGLARNIDFLDKENFNKLIQLFLEEVQEIEVATLSIADQKNVATAVGVWLDYIGKIVGEARKARTDKEYRSALLLKIAANNSDATPNTIIDLTKQYTSSNNSRIIDYFPAGFFNVIQIPSDVDTIGLTSLMGSIKPVGVSATVVNNIDGNRFVPAWIVGSGFEVEVPFSVIDEDGESYLELDDGDTFAVAITNFNLVNTEYSYFDTIAPSAFSIVSGGVEYTLGLNTGEILDINTTTNPTQSNTEGLLAQVVVN